MSACPVNMNTKSRPVGDEHGTHIDIALCAKRQRLYHSADAEDKQNVEDIRAHNVAHGDVCIAFAGRDGRSRQFRQRGADGDDGQSDHRFADTQLARNCNGTTNDELTATEQPGQACSRIYTKACPAPVVFAGTNSPSPLIFKAPVTV